MKSISMRSSILFVLLLQNIAFFDFAKASDKPVATKPLIDFSVEKYQLPNGLTVVMHQDRSVPIVSYQTWFKVGSKDELPGYTGIAHLFEHMMFKGAKRYTNQDFDIVLKKVGANYNAFTTQDYTGYYIDLTSDKLEKAIDLESDRLEFLQLNAENLKSEREVVKEERRYRYETSVSGSLFEATFGNLFNKSPYRWPVIGYMTDLNTITLDQCKAFFKQFYSVNNAVVVVAGDFDKPYAKKLIEKYYGHMKPSVIERPKVEKEPALTSAKVKIVPKDVQTELFSLSYEIPPQGSDESFAFDLLSNVLGEGSSSRLYNKIVRDSKLADGVYAANYSLKLEGIFMFNVNMKAKSSDAEREKVLKIIDGEIWRVQNVKISEKELEKAKTQVMKGYVDSLKTINGRARLLATYEAYFDDYTRIFSDLDKYNRVTGTDIQNLAKKYLNKNQSSLVVIKPTQKTAAVEQ